jgi:hypothetical protein
MIDSGTRLRVARGIAKTETEASEIVFKTLKNQRGHPDKPPPTVSDGWGGIREAMVAVYGQVPAYSGVGRPPTHKQPGDDWQYLQVVKQRENGRVIGTELRVIYGDEKDVLELLGKSTSYIERSHLTSRHFNSRLTRKTLAFSKVIAMHNAAATLEDVYYNFVRPHKSLRLEVNQTDRRWQPRTPAMASALTDHIWTVKELFSKIPIPSGSNT